MSWAAQGARSPRHNKAWPRPQALRLDIVCTGINSALSAICLALPLCQVLGYEYALVTSLAAACWSPWLGLQAARQGKCRPPGLGRAWLTATAALLPGLGLMLLGGLWVPPCNVALGLTFFALMPVGCALTGATIGWLTGTLTRSWRPGPARAALAAVLTLALALSLLRLYFEPPIVLFDPLWGYFAGSLYDEAIEVPQALWAIRTTTLVMLVVAWLVACAHSADGRRGRVRAAAALAVVGLALQVRLAERAAGSGIDHAAIEQVLDCTEVRPGITVHLPCSCPPDVRRNLADEHAFRLADLAARMQLTEPPVVHSYVYANAAQKAALMGGGQTMVAKPWLHEVHIHGTDVPHPLLAHELVHALAAAWAPGPLHVSARWGLAVNMGLVEGLAVALAPDGLGPDVLTSARALYAMGLQVPTASLLGGAGQFWRLAPARAYTQAGALLRFIEARNGMAAVRALYGSADAYEVLHEKPDALERAFIAWLQVEQTPAPPSHQQARAQLRTPSIFARTCPHEVARLRQRAAAAQPAQAQARWQEVLQLTAAPRPARGAPRDRLAWARATYRLGQEAQALQEVDSIAHEPGHEPAVRARALLLWAQWAARRTLTPSSPHAAAPPQQAAWLAACSQAAELAAWRGADREAWLTAWAITEGGPKAGSILALLLGEGPEAGGAAAASLLAGLPETPSAQYLWGRLLYREGADALAYPHLADRFAHPNPAIEAERHHIAARVAYRLRAWPQVAHHARALLPPVGPEPYWGWAADVLHRAEAELTRSPSCPASTAPPPR